MVASKTNGKNTLGAEEKVSGTRFLAAQGIVASHMRYDGN
jgi:hypothetical protein